MKVYVDLIIVLNFIYDFLIISSTATLLKRNIKTTRALISALIGEFSLITLFISLDTSMLIIFKVLLSVIMVYISFGKKHFIENLFYFYIITIILGGTSYLLGGDKYVVNVVFLAIISPFLITLYIKSIRTYKEKLNLTYDVIINDGNKTYKLIGYLDTGNNLICPLCKLPVILVKDTLELESNKVFYVPYEVVNKKALLKCYKVDKVVIGSKEVKCLLGLCEVSIFKEEVEVILNNSLREMI